MRAAVLGCTAVGGTPSDGSEPLPRVSATRERTLTATVVPLPAGVRAAGLGRSALNPHLPEWRDAQLGAPQRVDARLPGWVILVLRNAGQERTLDPHEIPGPIDVPVFVEPATGNVVALDEPAIVAEAEAVRDTAMQLWRREEGWLRTPRFVLGAPRSAVRFAGKIGGSLREGVADLVADVRAIAPAPQHGERPDDGSHEPIEGVGYRTWITVRGGLVRDAVDPAHVELYATHRDVPPGRWPAIDAAWSARAAADPRLAAWTEHDVRRLQSLGSRWDA